jgi:sulfur carrier protein
VNVVINGEKQTIQTDQTVEDLLNVLGYEGQSFAVAVEGEFVPREKYGSRIINEGEQIEIVAPMQGG